MAKQKKKRTKAYHGADAKNARPEVIRISAANRSAPSQWLYEHRKVLKPALIAAAVLIVVLILSIGLIGALNS